MAKEIIISAKAFETIQQDGENRFPNECCGFFFGTEKDGQRMVEEAYIVENVKQGDQRRRFEISPLDYVKAERYALATNQQLLGVYHSHPNHPAIASEHDLQSAWPNFSYIIISIQAGQFDHIQSWILKEDERAFEEEQVLITQYANV